MAAAVAGDAGDAADGGSGTPMRATQGALITSVTIKSHVTRSEPGIGKKSKYTAFVITVTTQSGQEWSVERRYSEFWALNKVRLVVPRPSLLSHAASPML